jgi:hypothetical protein
MADYGHGSLVIPLQGVGNAGRNAFFAVDAFFAVKFYPSALSWGKCISGTCSGTIRVEAAIAWSNRESSFSSGVIFYPESRLFDGKSFEPGAAAGIHAAVTTNTLFPGNNPEQFCHFVSPVNLKIWLFFVVGL